jgi:hypothetical protein
VMRRQSYLSADRGEGATASTCAVRRATECDKCRDLDRAAFDDQADALNIASTLAE